MVCAGLWHAAALRRQAGWPASSSGGAEMPQRRGEATGELGGGVRLQLRELALGLVCYRPLAKVRRFVSCGLGQVSIIGPSTPSPRHMYIYGTLLTRD